MSAVTRHLYRCPVRWADMDALQHVNNVTYVDYLQEARVDMLQLHASMRGGEELAEGVVVVRHEVDYLAPLVFRKEPVSIDVWVTHVGAATFTLAYEVYDDAGDTAGASEERVVYARAQSVLTPYLFGEERPRRISDKERQVLERIRDTGEGPGLRSGRVPRADGGARRHRYDCYVRFSDVDIYRHVNNVKYYEYIQEARIDFLLGLTDGDPADALSVVVRAIDVEYARPVLLRPEPYVVESWVHHIGTSSFVVISEIRDPVEVLARARAVVVAFDSETHRSVPLTDAVRDKLTQVAAG